MKTAPAGLLDMERRRGACGGYVYDSCAAMGVSGMKKTKGGSKGGGEVDLGLARVSGGSVAVGRTRGAKGRPYPLAGAL